MKPSVYTKISVNIIMMFLIAMIMSVIPDMFPNYFGDWHCLGRHMEKYNTMGPDIYSGCDYDENTHTSQWHWGWRHFLWFFMGLCLFIVQIMKIVVMSKKYSKKLDEKN